MKKDEKEIVRLYEWRRLSWVPQYHAFYSDTGDCVCGEVDQPYTGPRDGKLRKCVKCLEILGFSSKRADEERN